MAEEKDSIYNIDQSLIGKKPEVEPRPDTNIGIDTDSSFFNDLAYYGTSGSLDLSSLDSFLSVAGNRDQTYNLIDMMAEDSTIGAVLETYVEDATVPNDNGDVIWAVSSNPNVEAYISYILRSFKVNKNAYKWARCLFQYGDVYLRLLRKSDFRNDALFSESESEEEKEKEESTHNTSVAGYAPSTVTPLREDFNEEIAKDLENVDKKPKLDEEVKVRAYRKDDSYAFYLEMMPNPAEMFELTRYDESYAYLKATLNSMNGSTVDTERWAQGTDFLRYKFKKSETVIYEATEFAHGCLEDEMSRTPEEVQIFMSNENEENAEPSSYIYRVRRGQSLLYGAFRIWRELQLLENSILLNRVTKSSTTRAIQVEVGDMPKEMVQPHMQGIKQLMEQKTSLDVGGSIGNYTNPGPIVNNVYIPTKNGQGALSVQTLGDDGNPGHLEDLDYFRDKLFAALKVPKQYFGFTDDSTGFNGGSSLSIIDARYAKTVKRGQNALIQAVTDAVNIILKQVGADSYIPQYTLKMTAPVTQTDLDNKEINDGRISQTSSVMQLFRSEGDHEDTIFKYKGIQALIAPFINNQKFMDLLQEKIDDLERLKKDRERAAKEASEESDEEVTEEYTGEPEMGGGMGSFGGDEGELGGEESLEDEEEFTLPSPEELGLDFTDTGNFE